jgi:hypothetical protein
MTDQEKALQALRQAEAGPIVPDKVSRANSAPVAVPAPAAEPAPAPTAAVAPETGVPAASPEDQNKALQALRQAEAGPIVPDQFAHSDRSAAAREAQIVAEAQQQAAAMKKAQEQAPVSPPPAPVLSKEQKLADLLRRYQADEITPYEYHMERAKIVAEP